MDQDFWHRRWKKNEIGFHMTDPHHYLLRFFSRLQMQPFETVFVPLCGKSPDLVWLRERGLNVVGIELSRTAVEAFVIEHGLTGQWSIKSGLTCFIADGYKIYSGDFFDLTAAELDGARSVYDRGSLVALPPQMRVRYAEHLAALLPSGFRVLLISYIYDQIETPGPPFSVPQTELECLFAKKFQIEILSAEDALWSHQGLASRGVTRLEEYVVLLTRN